MTRGQEKTATAETGRHRPECQDRLTIEFPLDGFTQKKLDNLSKLVAAKETIMKQALGIDYPLRIEILEDRIAFSWFDAVADSAQVNAYAQLIAAICCTAKEKTRVYPPQKKGYPNPRYAMRSWLNAIGLIGDEFKLIRKLMTASLPGDSAWSTGVDPRKVKQDAAKATVCRRASV